MHHPAKVLIVSLAFGVLGCSGGMVVGVRDPGPTRVYADDSSWWLVAGSERREGMHRYRYYEADQVYYDLDSHVYYYQDNYEGPWITVTTLPTYVVLENSRAVDLDIRSTQPYQHHEQITHSYPPGQAKEQRRHNSGRGNGNGNGNENGNGRDHGREHDGHDNRD